MAKMINSTPSTYKYYEPAWITWMIKIRGLAEPTIVNYIGVLRKLHDYIISVNPKIFKPLQHITQELMDGFFEDLKFQYSIGTRHIHKNSISVFNLWSGNHIIPHARIRMTEEDFIRLKAKMFLTPEMVKDVRLYISGLPEKTGIQRRRKWYKRVLWELMLHTGARKSELVRVTMDDIVFSDYAGYILIGGSKNMNTREPSLIWRQVPIFSDSFKGILKAYVKKFKPTEQFLPVNVDLLSYWVREFSIKTGHNIHPHLTRHYFITKMLEDGINPKDVALMVGDTVTTILQSYHHPTLEGMTDRLQTQYNGKFI